MRGGTIPPLFHRRAGNSRDIRDFGDIDRKLKNPWPSESFAALNFQESNYSNELKCNRHGVENFYSVKIAQELKHFFCESKFSTRKFRPKFVEGKHFFSISGNDLKGFKNSLENFESVQIAKRTPSLTLWTEREGVAMIATVAYGERYGEHPPPSSFW